MKESRNKLLKAFKIILLIFSIDTTFILVLLFFHHHIISEFVVWGGLVFGIIFVLLLFTIEILGVILLFNSFVNYLQRRKGFEKKLNDDYFNEYKTIKTLISASFTGTRRKDILNDVLDLFLSAQEKGRNSKEVVGNSEEFAIKIIESYGLKSNGWLNFLLGANFTTFGILGYHFGNWLTRRKSFFSTLFPPMNVIFMVLFGLVFFSLVPTINMENGLKKRKIFALVFILGSIFLMFFSCFIVNKFYHFDLLNYLIEPSIPMIPNIFVLVLYVFVILSYIFCSHFYRKKAFQQLIKKSKVEK